MAFERNGNVQDFNYDYLGIHCCYNRRKRRIEKSDNNDIKMKSHESETKTVPNTQNVVIKYGLISYK
jgi:hypothetical protein